MRYFVLHRDPHRRAARTQTWKLLTGEPELSPVDREVQVVLGWLSRTLDELAPSDVSFGAEPLSRVARLVGEEAPPEACDRYAVEAVPRLVELLGEVGERSASFWLTNALASIGTTPAIAAVVAALHRPGKRPVHLTAASNRARSTDGWGDFLEGVLALGPSDEELAALIEDGTEAARARPGAAHPLDDVGVRARALALVRAEKVPAKAKPLLRAVGRAVAHLPPDERAEVVARLRDHADGATRLAVAQAEARAGDAAAVERLAALCHVGAVVDDARYALIELGRVDAIPGPGRLADAGIPGLAFWDKTGAWTPWVGPSGASP